MIVVREIRTRTHVEALVRLGKAFLEEARPTRPFVAWKLKRELTEIAKSVDRPNINAWVAYDDDNEEKPIGFFAGVIQTAFYNDDKIATLQFMYITPPYRGSWTWLKLMKAFEEWARLEGAVEFHAGNSTHVNTDRVTEALTKIGYVPFGAHHVKMVS